VIRHATDRNIVIAVDKLAAEVQRLRAATALPHATLAALKSAEKAAATMRLLLPVLANATRRARIEAEKAEAAEARAAEAAERRNAAIVAGRAAGAPA